MFNNRKGIYIIAAALTGLLGMQGMWLYYAIMQEKRNLANSTRQAALETLQAIEQKEDSRLIISSLDTLLHIPSVKGESKLPKAGKVIIVETNNNKTTVKNNSEETITTAYSYSGNGLRHSEVKIIRSNKNPANSIEQKKARAKIKNYEHLLKKIVYQSQPKKIEERINFNDLIASLKNSLVARGIEINPEAAIKDNNGKTIFKTTGYIDAAGIELPMFTKDIVFQNYSLHLFYPSTLNYLFRRAIGIIVLSLAVTFLLILVILLLYKKMLTEQKLNQYKNDFINNLTHELKTPLATISLANSNIRSSADYSQQDSIKQYTRIIDEENKKLNNHIEKVFELSLLEKEKQLFNIHKYNVNGLIQEAIKQNASAITSKQATIVYDLTATGSFVNVDEFHFVNALSNIIDNALKYNEANPEIIIASSNENDSVKISIKDNGIGISKEHQHYIFDKFFRVTHNNIHTTKGFGIGLSYVKQTIEQFKGTISVNSDLNKGTEFVITLPHAKN